MKKRLQILHLEDEPDFAELLRSLLAQDGIDADLDRVGDRKGFEKALAAGNYDLVISDYHLPSFNGLEALKIVREKYPDLPFILVSGTIGEQAAIDSLKSGATDYIIKQKPERLCAAVRRAVQEAGERNKLRQAEVELVRREKYFRTITENAIDILTILDEKGTVTYKSPSVKNVLGYEPNEMVGQSIFMHIHPDDLPRVQEGFQSVLTHPEMAVTLQFRCQHKDGSWRHLECIGQNRLADPDIRALVVNSRDVTDRWRAEEALRASEKQYRLLFQNNPNPMWVFDLETLAFLEVNTAAIEQYGYSREEFLGMKLMDLRPYDKGRRWENFASDVSERGLVWRHQKKNGEQVDAEVVWSPMAFQQRFAALAMALDVTERRRVEHRNQVFSKLSHHLSAATTAPEAAMIICEAADELFHWNDFALDIYDAAHDEVFSLLNITTVEGQRVQVPSTPQPKTANALIRRVIEKGAELILPSEGKNYSAATMLAPVRKGERVIGILLVQNHLPSAYRPHDLEMLQTLADQCSGALERVQAREQLRESEKRFRDLFENSPDAIFVENLDGTVLDVNFAGCVLHGLTREQLIGKNAVNDLVSPSHRKQARQYFQELVAGKLSWVEGESLAADGRTTPVEVRAGRVEFDGRPALLLHVRDVTDRRNAETALQRSEMLFRSVWENSVDGMRLTDEDGVIIAVNDAYCKFVEMDASSLEGKPFTVVYSNSSRLDEFMQRHREHFRDREAERKIEHQYVLHNGHTVCFEITESFVEAHGRPLLMLSLFRDVTTQRLLEEQLRQSQKMEAIGQLAGGVAHDFNNILTVIHGHGSLLLLSDLDDTAARSAQQITQAAERAAGLTRQLLTFSRRQLIQPKKLDLNKIVGNMTDMLGRLLGEDVSLQLNYCQSPATVEADAGMMEQVLLNLAVNARDAMPRGGRLAVRISIVQVNEEHLRRHPEARVGTFVCVSKSDTGIGIAPENISRIFEPFFTTKEIGKGTGLGLATVYGIVKQHQGWIEVESIVGKGTTFRFYIPFVGSEQPESEKPSTQILVRGGTETILLVEDEKPVRELVARVLEKHGYKILQAGTGVEAIQVWREHKDEIALLLTDLVMPDNMNGRELAEALWQEQPELKVVFTSGYSADIVGKDFRIEADTNFLQKPYHPQLLALTVRKCLDGKQN
jgi:PAS domain S-box-containing protein